MKFEKGGETNWNNFMKLLTSTEKVGKISLCERHALGTPIFFQNDDVLVYERQQLPPIPIIVCIVRI